MIFQRLKTGIEVSDTDFDAIYSKRIKKVSEFHFTPVEVAKIAAQFLVEKSGATGGGWNTFRPMPQAYQWAAEKSRGATLLSRNSTSESRQAIKRGASPDEADGVMWPLKTLACPMSGGLDRRFFINCTH